MSWLTIIFLLMSIFKLTSCTLMEGLENPTPTSNETYDSHYVAIHYGSAITSLDGIHWTPSGRNLTTLLTTGTGVVPLLYASNRYMAWNVRKVATSPDGISWTGLSSATGLSGGAFYSIIYTNNIYVGAGKPELLHTSPDGVTWTDRNPTTKDFNQVIYANNHYIAVGGNGTIVMSSDSTNWLTRTSGGTAYLVSVAYGNGRYVVFGQDYSTSMPALLTSIDGTTWTNRSAIISAIYLSIGNPQIKVIYANNIFVAGGGNSLGSVLMSSPDGVTWTDRVPSQLRTLNYIYNKIVFGQNGFVLLFNTGVLISPDGINWTHKILPPIDSNDISGLTFGPVR